MEAKSFKAIVEFQDEQPGHVVAAFSVFNNIDKDGDVVLPSFFRNNQPIVMASWGHNWGDLPPGKGVIRVEPDKALFDGEFFLDTPQGDAHYRTIKRVAELQEWSFSFNILDAYMGDYNGQKARFLREGEIYEVSPVLIGANRQTHTVAIKGISYVEEAEAVLAAVNDLLGRSESLADLRAKEGRTLSENNRTRLRSLRDAISALATEIEELLEGSEPKQLVESISNADPGLKALYDTFKQLDSLYGAALTN